MVKRMLELFCHSPVWYANSKSDMLVRNSMRRHEAWTPTYFVTVFGGHCNVELTPHTRSEVADWKGLAQCLVSTTFLVKLKCYPNSSLCQSDELEGTLVTYVCG